MAVGLATLLGEELSTEKMAQAKQTGKDLAPLPNFSGPMLNDFIWLETDEPHASRRKQILAKHPEIRALFGHDPWATSKILAVVLAQVALAYVVRNWSWPAIVAAAYCVGAFFNHNLFLAIHEISHNLASTSPFYNRCLGIFANLPIGVPMSITFQKYHMEHHRFQGVEGWDVDIPTYTEGRYIRNTFSKLLFIAFQLFFYALRPLVVKPKTPGTWEFINLSVQLSFDAALVYFMGWRSLAYLLLATFLGGGLHPMAGHFVAEHYVLVKGEQQQETYSYYGPLNWITWHVGYHNEHHDFPRIPGNRLDTVRKMAPEFYANLDYHSSWTMVLWKYITDPTVGPYNRVMRKPKGKSE